MSAADDVLERMRAICLALPDTKLTMTWGKPHFRVGEKIFAGCGEEDGWLAVGFKLEKAHQAEVLEDPRFRVAPYVGRHGWVQMDASRVRDWDEVRALVRESYRLIAPRASLAKLGGAATSPAAPAASRGATRRGPGARARGRAAPQGPPSRRTPARRRGRPR